MARGRSNKRMRSVQRDSARIPTDFEVLRRSNFTSPTFLTDVEDQRDFHFEPDPPAVDIRGRPVRFAVSSVVRPPSVRVHRRSVVARDYYTNMFRGFQLPYGIKYQSMFPVVTCVRRKMRRMVLFALGRTKKGSRGSRRRNDRSGVKC